MSVKKIRKPQSKVLWDQTWLRKLTRFFFLKKDWFKDIDTESQKTEFNPSIKLSHALPSRSIRAFRRDFNFRNLRKTFTPLQFYQDFIPIIEFCILGIGICFVKAAFKLIVTLLIVAIRQKYSNDWYFAPLIFYFNLFAFSLLHFVF